VAVTKYYVCEPYGFYTRKGFFAQPIPISKSCASGTFNLLASEGLLTEMILASKNFGSQWSAFTTSQASDAYAPYSMAGALADDFGR
jgi:hypothetical protein